MSTVEQAEALVAKMTRGEKAQLLQHVARDLGDAYPGIDLTDGVAGGDPCIARTRIPVWTLEQARRAGASEAELLRSYPGLRAEDLANAWAYVRAHRAQIDAQIQDNEAAQRTALRLLADENFPFPVVEALRSFGYDVLTVKDLGVAGQALIDAAVLKLASDDSRAVLTLNRKDFVRLHQSNSDHSGIVVCSFDLDFDGQAKRIRAALGAHSLLGRQLLRINRPG